LYCDVDSALDVTSVKFESEVFSDGCGVQFSNLEDDTFFIGKNDVFKEGGAEGRYKILCRHRKNAN
jgi:hypothetical protein